MNVKETPKRKLSHKQRHDEIRICKITSSGKKSIIDE